MNRYHVTVDFQGGRNDGSRLFDIKAEDENAAIDIAHAKVKKLKGFIKIDGGDVYQVSNQYIVTVQHDYGKTRLRINAFTEEKAKNIVIAAEHCPECAILKIRQL